MPRHPGRPAHFLLVISIVGTILGMEIDVIAGPLAPASLAVLLCDLHAPDSSEDPARRAVSRPVPNDPSSARAALARNAGSSEASVQVVDTLWPAAIASRQHRRDGTSILLLDAATASIAGSGPLRLRESEDMSLRRPCATRIPQFCRFIC